MEFKPCQEICKNTKTEATREKIKKIEYEKNKRMTHGLSKNQPRLFGMWMSMKSRCENPNRDKYKDYGGRGIVVCKEWHDAAVFATWAFSNGYKEGLQIDRIDNDKGYYPENCRWVTPKKNSRNRRNTKFITINNVTKCVAEWVEDTDLSCFTVYWWIKKYGENHAALKMIERGISG